ncbi:peroxisomal oxidase [Auriscalpium vulgare]|uniref:Peroxisomal oxidase n=1 Tax=Auriscalpium vulgare TaxID=40419 RepID=A0ACB8RF36_9AGAM|nr:peroxisomal oxidase [Auriscalpium vulgare]
MSRGDLYTRALAMTKRIYELRDALGWSAEETQLAISLLDDGTPITLHDVAFEPVLLSQASDTLLARYATLVRHRGIIGCYLQTELGHGSNVAALETTATYLPTAREFEVHSPTLTSTKWWVGALGRTATHGVVQAQLVLPGGEKAGPHLFFVQLRSLEDHTALPGIRIGDIGPKALGGWATTDHGFAQFTHVRIPRENMLSKFAQVTEDGRYVKPPHSKMSYGGMLYIRSSMVTTAGWTLAKAATVSLRYTTVRRQGGSTPTGSEQQVLHYPSVYYRLLPVLARAYVFIHLGRYLTAAFSATTQRLAAGDTSSLAEMHATTSALKVLVTTATARDIEAARRALGGHGFSAFAGLGTLYAQYLPSATYEGDNFVLDEQVVRAALKAFHALRPSSESTLSPSTQYLRLLAIPRSELPLATHVLADNPGQLVLMLELRAARVVEAHADRVQDGGLDAGAAQRLSNAVADAFVAVRVSELVDELVSSSLLPRDQATLRDLYILYLLVTLESALSDLLSFAIVSAGSTRTLREQIAQVCLRLLPEAVALSDAFGLSDWELDSALGVYNGCVYEALWERVQTEPMNQARVTPAYETHIKPILERGQKRAAEDKAKL